ncbi:unnamed protein product [Enterobius vermicularis]|uniref:Integrase catalytic domain-containing protein n=1 Tax=Enterobius vermicularis TaxID=51028 RepID=A0A0N4USN7_ENTVE|nr:unnamed protein product [Enterobius vermicularis]
MNRLREIKQAKGIEFRYLPSKENIVDLATRGCTLQELVKNQRWWKGPHWLSFVEEFWPKEMTYEDLESEEEWKQEHQIEVLNISKKHLWIKLSDFSSGGYITAMEQRTAEYLLVRLKQQQFFSGQITAVKKDKRDKLKDRLGLYLDNQILRCAGRYQSLQMPEDKKYPTLISHQGKPYALSRMPPLPTFEGNSCRPFEIIGLDYFGPVLVKRFIALRSQPRIIYSDNATQFRAANKTLAQLWNKLIVDQELCTYYANQGIIWRFITEYAPWQGVYYERTLIYEVVAIVNSRPLTYVYDEPTSPIIRPMDFLQLGGPTGLIPVGTFEDPDYILPQEGKELFNLYKGNLALTDAYWEVFKEEYLLSEENGKWGG